MTNKRTISDVATTRNTAFRKSRVSWLLMTWGLIGAVWFGLLPWIASQPTVATRLTELDAQGIDPSAMFYSELPAMNGVLAEIDALHQRNPQALWNPRSYTQGSGTSKFKIRDTAPN